MSAKTKILRNLEGRVHPVNVFVATHGLDFDEGNDALNELISSGDVRIERSALPGGRDSIPLYRLGYRARGLLRTGLHVVVDNSPTD